MPHMLISEARANREHLKAQFDAYTAEAEAIARKAAAEKRDLDTGERASVDHHLKAAAEASHHLQRIAQADDDASLLKSLGNLTGAQPFTGAGLGGAPSDAYAPGGDAQQRWSSVALKAMTHGEPGGHHRKALAVAGSVTVPTTLDGTVIREGERPSLVRALLPVQVLTATDRFGWMQQTVSQTNAAPVPRGGLKPTSVYSVTRREDRVRVIAHLSEPVDRIDLEDSAGLSEFIDAEMRQGVIYASEDQLVSGDGIGENLHGFLNTEGTTAQPFAGDVLGTLRRALTTQQVLRNVPSAWVLSPLDWQDIELLREDGATGSYLLAQGPVDRAAQKLWGLPVVVTDAMPAGRGLLGDFTGSARLYVREQTVVSWSEAMWRPDGQGGGTTDFSKNRLTMRAEERIGLAVLRPSAFTEVDLTAGA